MRTAVWILVLARFSMTFCIGQFIFSMMHARPTFSALCRHDLYFWINTSLSPSIITLLPVVDNLRRRCQSNPSPASLFDLNNDVDPLKCAQRPFRVVTIRTLIHVH
ncbi:hypothetical protein BC834DRAFT_213002 [Gloeopeniophorella convolvens]|nr:hypothetical protein BC834DRAFT_213002 [Gloeopeniophorella convolvens]